MQKTNEVQATEDFTVKVMFDRKYFSQKPSNDDAKGINYRIAYGLTTVTIKQLADEVGRGRAFMAGTLTEKNGVLRRSINNWHSQQVIALDFDDGFTLKAALNDEFIRSNAAFLYTSFSHSEALHKFRVVFFLDSVITKYTEFKSVIRYLFAKYPQVDKACKDGSRIFYGGREVYWIKETNRLNSKFCITESLKWDKKNNLSISHPKPPASPKKKNTRKSKPKILSTSNIELIKNKDVQGMKELVSIEPRTLKQSKFEDFLKQMSLPEYLGIYNYKSFNDIFHDELNPSASIYSIKWYWALVIQVLLK
ncbi:hypothetical protein [Psychrobacillus sp. L3]|uniref:hypothetical protein n=1 Tax=Psychrobacillus sp. L3 TaxID=3236891 RepID=UPI0036F2FECC